MRKAQVVNIKHFDNLMVRYQRKAQAVNIICFKYQSFKYLMRKVLWQYSTKSKIVSNITIIFEG